jgi:hypothetical protein
MSDMEAEGGGIRYSLETPPWAVRIRHDDGRIVGTGILLSPDRVLTCAHVVARGERFTAEFVGASGRGTRVPYTSAWVLDDAYRPETRDADDDPSGDVALLRLERPRPQGEATTLYRLSAPDRRVRMYGFPAAYNGGIWLRATIMGGCGRDGQVQLAPATPGELARPGFSGGGVVDQDTGEVIGMVLTGAPEPGGAGFSFMSPAETIVQHLPQVTAWTRGRTAVDVGLRSTSGGDEGVRLDGPFAQRLARWFRDDRRDDRRGDHRDDGRDGRRDDGRRVRLGSPDPDRTREDRPEDLPENRRRDRRPGHSEPQVKISVVGHAERAREATLRRAITLADRELRTRPSTDRASLDPPDTVPRAGGLDLAIQATGQSTGRIAGRIAERMGLRQRPGEPPAELIRSAPVTLTLVMVGVDEAADPGTLLDLLVALAEQGSRLLLVFRTEGAHYERARRELVTGPAQQRLARLAEKLAEITGPLAKGLEHRGQLIRADTEKAARALIPAYAMQAELAGAGGVLTALGQDADLGRYERKTDEILRRLRATAAELDRLLARQAELLGRLGPYRAIYKDKQTRRPHPGNGENTAEEDLEEAALFVAAHRLLRARPCDLAAAEAAVHRYTAFVDALDTLDTPQGPVGPDDAVRPYGPDHGGPGTEGGAAR